MKFKPTLDKILETILVIIMAIMVINVLWQVGSRYIMQSPSSFTDELARYLLIWLSILGASYVTGKKMHLSIDLLAQKISPEKRKPLNTLVYVVVALFALLAMVIGGSRLVYIVASLGQTSPALEIPLSYVYIVLPIGGVIIIYYSILNMKYPEKEEDRSISDTVQ
ncbi:TRAP transporter small permease [Catalinimonas niigatensis]|uniref:TRAP transporter small permease n=1 Tax=Catalinimonas niigatensis TaxID=1397264 RepID=UPI002666C36B|nr:TRAP transporter small permease [Catalinimonas niigatensis]WPP51229.1 TRAP transporter small permease [Catalinimonas niigatensis]